MPLLFALSQHPALVAAQSRLESDKLMAFLDDVYIVSPEPDLVGNGYAVVQHELFHHAKIQINRGKTKVWNRAGASASVRLSGTDGKRVRPPRTSVERIGQARQPVGLKVLGTPLGHPVYVQEQLEIIAAEHQQFLDKIPTVPDLQCAWALLLHCGSARANYFLRVVQPECTVQFAALHDEGLWRCFCSLLDISNDCTVGLIRDSVSLPLSLGGLGLRSATRSRVGAYWASWADALHMIYKRHRSVAEEVVRNLHNPRADCVNLWAVASAAHHLDGVRGFEVLEWDALLHDARPPLRDADVFEPGGQRSGWQHEATSRVEQLHRERNILPALAEHEKALLRPRDVVMLLKLLQLASAGKQVPVSERMSSSGTWISEPPSTIVAVWRSAYSWPLTPLLCQPSIAMGPLSLPKRADAKSAFIPNWSAPGGAPGL